MSKGMMLIGGRQFEITSICLRNARFEVTAERPGPCPALTGEPVVIFGEDGIGVLTGGTLVTERGAAEGEIMHVFVSYQVQTAYEKI